MRNRPFGHDVLRPTTTWLTAALVLMLFLSACSSDQGDSTTTTESPESDVAVLGQPCSPPGRFAETADGESAICSATTAEGESLATPVWRLAAGDTSRGLGEEEAAAVELVRQTFAAHPAGGEWPEDDETTLLFVNEIASAARVASQQGLEPASTFTSLVNGYSGANGVSTGEATAAITGLVLGVAELFEGEPAGIFASEMLEAAAQGSGE